MVIVPFPNSLTVLDAYSFVFMLPVVVVGVVILVLKGIALLPSVRELEIVKVDDASWPVRRRRYGSVLLPSFIILAVTPVVPETALIES